MAIIRFNPMIREIQFEGTESFVASNFVVIEKLMTEGILVKKQRASLKTRRAAKRLQPVETPEQLIMNEIIVSEGSAIAEDVSTEEPGISEDLGGVNTGGLPIQECILTEDESINRDSLSASTKEMPAKVSVTSLKEKFGLNERQIEKIIVDAEKEGRIRRDMDGMYVWV